MAAGLMPASAFAVNTGSPQSSEDEIYEGLPDGNRILSDMTEKHGMYAHPRIIMSEDKFNSLKKHIGDGSVTASLLEKLRSEADSLLDEPASEYEIPDGIRLLEVSRKVLRRVSALALAYNVFGDVKYAERCYKELEKAGNFQDWNSRHFLDTAEMSAAFAVGYDWLYDWMNNNQKQFIKKALTEKGLNQVMDDYLDNQRTRTYKWYQDYPGCNWKLVCDGSMSMSALALGDEPELKDLCAEVLTYAYEDAYAFIRRAYDSLDGTYSEGLGYWNYATTYLGLYTTSIESAAGTDYGLADYEGLLKSADFIRYMCSNTFQSFSFGDAPESEDMRTPNLLWLGEYFGKYEISSMRIDKIKNTSFNYLDAFWLDEEKMSVPSEDIPTDWGSEGTSNASFRDTWDKSGFVAALHTGKNNYKYHSHFDLGTFFIESNGQRFFTDLGNEWYELPGRLNSYRVRAEGHNTLVINPPENTDQQDGITCLITESGSGNEAYALTDLTEAYASCDAVSVVRGLKMIKDKKCVILQDEITLNNPGEIYWFAQTRADIDVASDGKSAVLTIGGEKLLAEILGEGQFTVMDAVTLPSTPKISGESDNSAYRKLSIHLTDVKDTTISVAFTPLDGEKTDVLWRPSVYSLTEWSDNPYTENTALMGDINLDSKITAADAVMLNKYLLGAGEIKSRDNADLNCDGIISISDMVLMRNLLTDL